MRTVDLTVIGDRACSTTLTYLAYLHAAGLRPRRLWLVDFFPSPRRVHWVRRVLGTSMANRVHRLAKPAPVVPLPEFMQLCQSLQDVATPRPVDLFGQFDGTAYAEEVESFAVEDFNDPYLQRRIIEQSDTAFLYTSGGMVPGSLLDRPEIRMFHVHPGIVPEVRGSDGLLWSYRARGRLGASCFYMSTEIDEGAVIAQMEVSVPNLAPLRPYLTTEMEDVAYRALLFAVDPHLRAQLFVDVLTRAGDRDLRRLETNPQPSPSRPPYLWMHPRLRLRTMQDMVAS